jgi:molybdopterin-guanine dinucleotide biosynthesis protein A
MPGMQPPEAAPGRGLIGAILAGGQSRRLGRDKATLPLGGEPLACRLARLLAPLAEEVWLITNDPGRHARLGLPLVTDLIPGLGPLGGLATALFHARTPWVLLTAVDHPCLAPPLLAALAQARGRLARPVLVCRTAIGLAPFPGLYATRLLPRVQEFLRQDQTVRRFLAACRPQVWEPAQWHLFDPEGRSFLNLNRPEDVAPLERALVAGDKAPCTPLDPKNL